MSVIKRTAAKKEDSSLMINDQISYYKPGNMPSLEVDIFDKTFISWNSVQV